MIKAHVPIQGGLFPAGEPQFLNPDGTEATVEELQRSGFAVPGEAAIYVALALRQMNRATQKGPAAKAWKHFAKKAGLN